MTTIHLDETQTERLTSMLNVFDDVDREILYKIHCGSIPTDRRTYGSVAECNAAKAERRANWERSILQGV
jgi:hypothetical protein